MKQLTGDWAGTPTLPRIDKERERSTWAVRRDSCYFHYKKRVKHFSNQTLWKTMQEALIPQVKYSWSAACARMLPS